MVDPNSIFKSGIYRTNKPADGLTDEQRRMAQNLLKGDNLERLDKANATGRKFRPTPVHVSYEYYWLGGGEFSMGGWEIRRIENGRQIHHQWQQDTFEAEIARLRKASFTVREVHMGLAPRHKDQKPVSKRRELLDRLKGFRP